MQELYFKERNEILEFFKAKKRREKTRFIVLVGYSTGRRTKLASLLSNVIIGIFFLLFPPPPPLPLLSSCSSSSPLLLFLHFFCYKTLLFTPLFSKSFLDFEPGTKSHALEML